MIKYAIALCAALAASPSLASEGVASYYGGSDGLCGHRTATGERLNCNEHTAAHRSLPFGTRVRVSYGGRSVVVRINDRGPFVRGRVLDLNVHTARALGMGGTSRVQYEVLGREETFFAQPFGIPGDEGRGPVRHRGRHRRH